MGELFSFVIDKKHRLLRGLLSNMPTKGDFYLVPLLLTCCKEHICASLLDTDMTENIFIKQKT